MEKLENIDSGQQKQEPTNAEKVLGDMPSFEEHINKINNTKNWQEKAREKNYYQDENGEWWEHSDDWFDEKVSSFKLDVEYPEFADMVEEFAEKSNVKLLDGAYGLKMYIYDNVDRLSELNPETIDNMFTILGRIPHYRGEFEKTIFSRNERDTSKSLEKLCQYYDGVSDEAKNDREARRNIDELGEVFIENYDENLATDDFIEQLSRGASTAAQLDEENRNEIFRSLKYGVEGFSRNKCDGDLYGDYLDYALQLAEDNSKKLDVFCRYVKLHGFNKDTVEGFNNVIFPLMEEGNSEVDAIVNGGNVYGTIEYQYGIADYTEECLLSRCVPQEIDRLSRIYHEIPTSDYHKFEQNRQDALNIQGVIIGMRDFIHDERLGVHEILSTMEKYYNAKDDESRESIRETMVELDEKYPYAGFLKNALNLENYDKEIKRKSNTGEGLSGEKAIDVLRRLVKNTAPEEINPPKTHHDELNRLMENINPIVNEQTGEVKITLDEVAPAISEMNQILIEGQKKLGVLPSTISAVSYLDKMAANTLRGLNGKDIVEVIYDSGFKEILRFSQLTSSMKYSEADFESFYSRACEYFSRAYEDDGVDSVKVRDGWRFVGQKITENMSSLGKKYGSDESTKRFVETVWSGNLSHELIGMFERV